jgi:DNA-binding transcriptional LysR family regulator
MDRKDLELVLAIRRQASLTGAAALLGLAPSVVSKRLAFLESQLGLPLFHRTTRHVSTTTEGELVCVHAHSLLQSFSSLESALQEANQEPTGLIRLAATFGFGRLWLGPALADFQSRYPRVDIQLQLTEQLPDLSQKGFDGAVWLWSVPNRHASEWVSRRLAFNQRVVVASPDYIKRNGLPTSPQSLIEHQCLIVRENGLMDGDTFDAWNLQPENNEVPLNRDCSLGFFS